MLTVTLTPNRCDQDRYVRYVRYERVGDRVTAYGVTQNRIVRLPFSAIRGCDADPEFEAAWREHVRNQTNRSSK